MAFMVVDASLYQEDCGLQVWILAWAWRTLSICIELCYGLTLVSTLKRSGVSRQHMVVHVLYKAPKNGRVLKPLRLL